MKSIVALIWFLCVPQLVSAALIASQSFEGTAADTWSFTPTPVTYNDETTGSPLEVNGDQDVWAAIEEFTGDIDNPASGSRFWGMQDLNNPNGGGNFDHALGFDALDISGFEVVELTFQYNYVGFETSDVLSYELTFDGSAQGVIRLTPTTGSNLTSANWETETVSIPDSVSQISLRLIALQNGAEDYAGWDNIQLNGTPTGSEIPEPSTLTILLLGGGVFWGCRRARANTA